MDLQAKQRMLISMYPGISTAEGIKEFSMDPAPVGEGVQDDGIFAYLPGSGVIYFSPRLTADQLDVSNLPSTQTNLNLGLVVYKDVEGVRYCAIVPRQNYTVKCLDVDASIAINQTAQRTESDREVTIDVTAAGTATANAITSVSQYPFAIVANGDFQLETLSEKTMYVPTLIPAFLYNEIKGKTGALVVVNLPSSDAYGTYGVPTFGIVDGGRTIFRTTRIRLEDYPNDPSTPVVFPSLSYANVCQTQGEQGFLAFGAPELMGVVKYVHYANESKTTSETIQKPQDVDDTQGLWQIRHPLDNPRGIGRVSDLLVKIF